MKEWSDGARWWRNADGELHRTDGPAVEEPDGTRAWFLHDKLHRTDGPAVEHPSGGCEWYFNEELHRLDGPAIEDDDGTREWYQHGRRHRTDGPAVVYPDGESFWFVKGRQLTQEQFVERYHPQITQEIASPNAPQPSAASATRPVRIRQATDIKSILSRRR